MGVLFLMIFSELTMPKPKAAAKPQQTEVAAKAECKSAGGRMYTGVRLYLDPGCSKPFAKILGGGKREDGAKMVKIEFDAGAIEWKTRDAVRDQAYVQSNDPAIEAGLWQEFSN